jgi:hypothetical protein
MTIPIGLVPLARPTARAAGTAEPSGQGAVADRTTGRNLPKGRPHHALERRTAGRAVDAVQPCQIAREVGLERLRHRAGCTASQESGRRPAMMSQEPPHAWFMVMPVESAQPTEVIGHQPRAANRRAEAVEH